MPENTTDLIPIEATPVSMTGIQMTPALAMLFEQNMAARAWKAASLYANSSMVPTHFQGKPENCFIALQMAVRTGQDPFMLMQQMYVVKGRPGFFSAYVIGQLNVSGKIKGLIKYDFSGKPGTDEYGCTAWCIEKETGERIDGPKVDWKMVKAEGWNKPKGTEQSKWVGLSDLMFRYRSASYLIRTSFPEVLMGLQTKEELEDSSVDVSHRSPQAEKINALLGELGVASTQKDAVVDAKPYIDDIEVDPPFNPPTEQEIADAAQTENDPLNGMTPEDQQKIAQSFCENVRPDTRQKDRREQIERLESLRAKIGEENYEICRACCKEAGWTLLETKTQGELLK